MYLLRTKRSGRFWISSVTRFRSWIPTKSAWPWGVKTVWSERANLQERVYPSSSLIGFVVAFTSMLAVVLCTLQHYTHHHGYIHIVLNSVDKKRVGNVIGVGVGVGVGVPRMRSSLHIVTALRVRGRFRRSYPCAPWLYRKDRLRLIQSSSCCSSEALS